MRAFSHVGIILLCLKLESDKALSASPLYIRLINLQAEEARCWKERNDALQLHCKAWLGRFGSMLNNREANVSLLARKQFAQIVALHSRRCENRCNKVCAFPAVDRPQ